MVFLAWHTFCITVGHHLHAFTEPIVMKNTVILAALFSAFLAGCNQLETPESNIEEKESSFHATFVDMTFDGVLYASNDWNPERTIEQQLLYTIGQLNGNNAVGRLDKVEVTDLEIEKIDGDYRFDYTVTMPVAWGKTSPVPETYEFVLPISTRYQDLTRFAEKYGKDCVSYSAHDVDSGSMWYYYRPGMTFCKLDEIDVMKAVATVAPSTLQTSGNIQNMTMCGKMDVSRWSPSSVERARTNQPTPTSAPATLGISSARSRTLFQTLSVHPLNTKVILVLISPTCTSKGNWMMSVKSRSQYWLSTMSGPPGLTSKSAIEPDAYSRPDHLQRSCRTWA